MADRLRDSAFFMLMWSGFGRAVFFDLLDEKEKVPLWNGKVPVKDAMSNKKERFLQR
jgi:hypothetical protein